MANREVRSGFRDPEDQNPRQDYMLRQQSDVAPVAEGRNVFSSTWLDQRLARLDRSIPVTFAGNLDWDDAEVGDEKPRYNYSFWGEPLPAYNAEYPYNKVEQSESGHVKEVDDTPGHERLNEQHRTGTYREVTEHGTQVQKIIGDNYEIVCGDDFVYIKGRTSVTVDGSHHLLVLGNVYREVLGNEDVLIRGNKTERVSGDVTQEISGNYKQSIKGSSRERVEGGKAEEIQGVRYSWSGGDSFDITGGNRADSIGGNHEVAVDGDIMMQAEGAAGYSAVGDLGLQADGNLEMGAGGDGNQQFTGTLNIAAAQTNINDSVPGSPAGASSIAPGHSFSDEFEKTETEEPYPGIANSSQFVRSMPPKKQSNGTPSPMKKISDGLSKFVNRLFSGNSND